MGAARLPSRKTKHRESEKKNDVQRSRFLERTQPSKSLLVAVEKTLELYRIKEEHKRVVEAFLREVNDASGKQFCFT